MKTLTGKQLRAMAGVARDIERQPRRHRFMGGSPGETATCFLVKLGEKLGLQQLRYRKGTYCANIAYEVFGLGDAAVYIKVYHMYSSSLPAKLVASNIRRWIAEIKTAQGA